MYIYIMLCFCVSVCLSVVHVSIRQHTSACLLTAVWTTAAVGRPATPQYSVY